MSDYKLGCLPSTASPMDYSLRASAMPADAWTSPYIPVVGNQKVNNCVDYASSYACEIIDSFNRIYSKGYVYGEREPEHYQGPGMYPHEAMATLKKRGNVLQVNWPHEFEVMEAQERVKASRDILRQLAANHKIKAYYLLSDAAGVAAARMAGMAVIASVRVKKYECEANGFWDCSEARIGNHMITVIDFSNKYPALWRCLNSWGQSWGVNGMFYISSEDLFRNGQVYAIEAVAAAPAPPLPIVKRRTLKLKVPYIRDTEDYTDVSMCQKLLIMHGASITADGIFGPKTRAAVLEFQRRTFDDKDEWDGIVGRVTWAALDKDPVIEPEKEPNDTVTEFLNWLRAQTGNMYLWGAQGEKIYDGMVYGKKQYTVREYINRRESTQSNRNRAMAFFNKLIAAGKSPILAYDCSGLPVCYLLQHGFIKTDLSSRYIYKSCIKLARNDLKPGDFVFRQGTASIYHVGVYMGDGQVIESKGRDDGVVIRDINASGSGYWNRYGRLACLTDATAITILSQSAVSRFADAVIERLRNR